MSEGLWHFSFTSSWGSIVSQSSFPSSGDFLDDRLFERP